MRAIRFAACVVGLLGMCGAAIGADVVITDAGAMGDGKTRSSAAIQKTIDDTSAKGGGTVVIPAGKFVVGTIRLKDGVTLKLEEGAELLGSEELKDYQNVDPFKDGLGAEVGWAMIAAVDAKNVAIEGKGVIDGRGKMVAANSPFKGQGWGRRPMLVRFVRCDGVKLNGVTLKDSASWTTNLASSTNITIDGVKIDSHVVPHNDGIDIDSCQGVTIRNCDIESGDDAVCLKSTAAKGCRDVTVDGCRLKSNQGAIKLGTESYGGFEKVRVSNCQIRDTRNGGIKVLCVDGGQLSDVVVSDITMDNVRTPIFVRLGARLKTFREGDPKKPVGTLKDVTIRNVKARAAADAQIMPPSGMFITGIPDAKIENLTIENVEITLAGGGTAEDASATVQENIDAYPEINRFGKTLPAYGVFARHVKGLTLKGVSFTVEKPDDRPAIVLEDVAGAQLDGKGGGKVRMSGVSGVVVAGKEATDGLAEY